jgi:uncharacterized protein (TIGR02421 family)
VSIEDNIRKADDLFFEIFHDFNLFDFINPVNSDEEKLRFLAAWETRHEYNPVFQYSTIPASVEKARLKVLELSFGQSALDHCYDGIRNELIAMCQLCHARGTDAFTKSSVRIYGEPSHALVQEALAILRTKIARRDHDPLEMGVKGVVERFRYRLREERIDGWDVMEDPKAVGLALVDSSDHKIRLQPGVLLSQKMVDRLLHHEVGVHVYRCVNGERQPLKVFGIGFDGYLQTEEGLALHLEDKLGLTTSDIRRRYAARVLASAWASTRSFFDIFRALVEFFPEEEAFTLTQRSKRGVTDTSNPGGFIQDHIYLQGKKDVEWLSSSDLRLLYTGRIAVHHLPLIREMVNQKKILAPVFVPSVFHG